MGYYNKQEVDFIIRTKEIIRQYNEFIPEQETRYNVTLFINCMIGLLIIPQQHWYHSLPETEINEQEWGLSPKMITHSSNGTTVKSVATHLRNSIAHYSFHALPNNEDKLKVFNFQDKYPKTGKQTFNADIPYTALRKFVNNLTIEFLKEMDKQK